MKPSNSPSYQPPAPVQAKPEKAAYYLYYAPLNVLFTAATPQEVRNAMQDECVELVTRERYEELLAIHGPTYPNLKRLWRKEHF